VDQSLTYQAALDYLYRFINADEPTRDPALARRKLRRMRVLLALVGSPQNQVPAIVVAGTKGKGSTAAMLESTLRAAGYRTGFWLSPHLHTYRERIQAGGRLITQGELTQAVARLRPLVEHFERSEQAHYGVPTTFELGFALALRWFAEQKVQLAILEVGVGGRYDAANVVTPLISLISSISYDHTHILGDTLAMIAHDKAGVMKPGIPTVTVPQSPEAAEVLEQVSREVGAPLWVANHAALVRAGAEERSSKEGNTAKERETSLCYPVDPRPALRGCFQQENARLALGGLLLLREQGYTMTDEAMARGLALVQWPGRMEVVAGAPPLVLDGAHNGDSVEKLLRSLRGEFQFKRLVLVIGVTLRKDTLAIVAELVPHASVVVLTHSHHPRAQTDLEQLAAIAAPYVRDDLLLAREVDEALVLARSLARPDDLICVTGSLFLVGAAREVLGLAQARDE
jgi:dihydrofolate synthase/folylpolyglutamate synthase